VFTTTADGVSLWWEAEGDGPPVLLIPGRGDASDLYPRRFTDPLVAAGRQVIRFDPRDTGLSGDGGQVYDMADMVDDAVGVLDAADAERADVVGFSMGGLQLSDFATRYADRVRSVVFLSAMSLDPEAGMGENFFVFDPDPVAGALRAMGPTTEADRAWLDAELALASARAPGRPEAAERHQAAAFRGEWGDLSLLAEVLAPALVVHGDADQTLPLAHGHAIAAGVASGELVVMPGMGHLPRPAEWDEIAALTVRHLAA
jgi:pimeloyl-ACP methyl ester carboxylesterase